MCRYIGYEAKRNSRRIGAQTQKGGSAARPGAFSSRSGKDCRSLVRFATALACYGSVWRTGSDSQAPPWPQAEDERVRAGEISGVIERRSNRSRLAQQSVDSHACNQGDRAPFWDTLPPRACAKDSDTAARLDQSEAAVEGTGAQRGRGRALETGRVPAHKKKKPRNAAHTLSFLTNQVSCSLPQSGAPTHRGERHRFIVVASLAARSPQSALSPSVPSASASDFTSHFYRITRTFTPRILLPSCGCCTGTFPDRSRLSGIEAIHTTVQHRCRNILPDTRRLSRRDFPVTRQTSTRTRECGRIPSLAGLPILLRPTQQSFADELVLNSADCESVPTYYYRLSDTQGLI